MTTRNKGTYAASMNSPNSKIKSAARKPSSYVTLVSNTAEQKKISHVTNTSKDRPINNNTSSTNHEKVNNINTNVELKKSSVDGGDDNVDLGKLLLNMKLLKESLRKASMMGEIHFDDELSDYIKSLTNNKQQPVNIIESVWLVKRAISELHVIHNRKKQSGSGGGSAAVSAEFSLAGQLTDARALIATEREARYKAEQKLNEWEHMWRREKEKLEENGKIKLEEAVSTAVFKARKEGEVGAERIAERLKKSEIKCAELEEKLKMSEMKHSSSQNSSQNTSASSMENTTSTSKDKRMLSLEKQVSTFRRKESDLTSLNINLEAKVDRLSKELKANRPAPNSRGKMNELSTKVDELDTLLMEAHAQLKESKEIQVLHDITIL